MKPNGGWLEIFGYVLLFIRFAGDSLVCYLDQFSKETIGRFLKIAFLHTFI